MNDDLPTASAHDLGCEDFARAAGVSRRRVLAGLAGAASLGVAHSIFGGVFRQAVFGATASTNTVVVISLRGGVDGMSVVVPHADQAYYSLRPHIAIPQDKLLCGDSYFGLHPDLAPLAPLWQSGQLAAVQAVGMEVPNRSHFSAMEEIEDADPGSAVRRGWINRAIGLDADEFPAEAVQFGTTIVPTSMTGPSPVIATQSVKELILAGANPQWDDETWQARRRRQLETIWSPAKGSLGSAARAALATVDQLAPPPARPTTPTTARSIRPSGKGATWARRWRTPRS